MENVNQFQSFAKQNREQVSYKNKAIIYTRVTSQTQNDNLKVLDQNKQCLRKAVQLQLEVKKCFGGTYLSGFETQIAIEEMIQYAKAYQISNIIVYSYDRFTKKNLMATIKKIKSLGINVITVTQPKTSTINLSKLYQV